MAKATHFERSSIHAATDRALKTWAAQKRSMFVGIDGFTPRSIIARIVREESGTNRGGPHRQHWREVYQGDGALVQQIILTLEEVPRMTVTCRYLFVGPWLLSAGVQAEWIGIGRGDYWANLRLALAAVDSGIKLLSSIKTGEASTQSK
jgi:hypothetical protein